MASDDVRVRFAPSPTGYLHVGGARTALFNWLFARHHGGTFVLRIEDTDRSRHVSDSVAKITDDLRWLGLDWDEGPEVGGDAGPYFQSERLALYSEQTNRLLESGDAYFAMESPEELAAMRESAASEKRSLRYARPDPLPTVAEGLAARESGCGVTIRFKMPDRDIVVNDLVLGAVRIAQEELEDFVIQKSDGWPTYHFACVVDDALMRISHVLRGQEHLMNTPKHVALQAALGFSVPAYAHLPIIFNIDGSKMSKRDKEKALKKGLPPPEIDVHDFRAAGYLPEALLNFISLLGWNPGGDREEMTLDETAGLFSVDRIGSANAKFDRDKLVAFNTDWNARVSAERSLAGLKDFAAVNDAALLSLSDDALTYLLRVSQGFRTFRDIEGKASFLVTPDDAIEYDPKAVKKVLAKNDDAGYAMLESLLGPLEATGDWAPEPLEALLTGLCASNGIKLGAVAQPLRVAVTGSTVSPPIYDTLVILGKERSMNRIRRALELRRATA